MELFGCSYIAVSYICNSLRGLTRSLRFNFEQKLVNNVKTKALRAVFGAIAASYITSKIKVKACRGRYIGIISWCVLE